MTASVNRINGAGCQRLKRAGDAACGCAPGTFTGIAAIWSQCADFASGGGGRQEEATADA